MSEPDWNDLNESREWLEERYTGSPEAGSPMFQFCMDMGREAYRLAEHLSTYELVLYLEANGFTGGAHYPAESERIIYYKLYRHPDQLAAWLANTQESAKPTKSEPEAVSSAAKRKTTAKPGSNPGTTKSRSSKQQDIIRPRRQAKKAGKKSESDATLAATSRVQSLRPKRERKRARTGRVLQVSEAQSGLTRAF